jgi:hypothetical protein
MDKESYSVYCPCIDDTVKLVDCKSCVDMKDGKCQYQKKSADSSHKEVKDD